MSSSVFYQSTAAVPAASNSGISVMPVRDTFPTKLSEFHPEMHDVVDSSPSGLGCLRGVQTALLIEAASGLLIYGIWALLHMRR